MLFTSTDSMFNYLHQCYLPGDKVDIASYGMYLNITGYGDDVNNTYPTSVRKFIDSINKLDLRIIIGLPYYLECKPRCKDCKNTYNRTLRRHENTGELLGLRIRYHPNLHMKYYKVGTHTVVVGGINLSSSGFVDCSNTMHNIRDHTTLNSMFTQTWREAKSGIGQFLIK